MRLLVPHPPCWRRLPLNDAGPKKPARTAQLSTATEAGGALPVEDAHEHAHLMGFLRTFAGVSPTPSGDRGGDGPAPGCGPLTSSLQTTWQTELSMRLCFMEKVRPGP